MAPSLFEMMYLENWRSSVATSLEGVNSPGVNYARDPSKDPEKNVDAEIFGKQL
jgi:hypothetical protein